MKLVSLLSMVSLVVVSTSSLFGLGCGGSTGDPVVGEDDLTSGIGTGTYVVDSRPFGSYYVERITFAAGKKFEADMVSDRGDKSVLAGSYDILPARPNNPQSPVLSDKPTLSLNSDSGGGGVYFEYDKLPGGVLKLYHSARHVSFSVKLDPTWKPQATNTKTIACTGPAADAKLTLDSAQNRRGTLTITRKSTADRHDPPTVTVPVTKTAGSEVPGYTYFEGSKGGQDFYVNMSTSDFERGSGSVTLHLMWAEGGQEWSVGETCAFSR